MNKLAMLSCGVAVAMFAGCTSVQITREGDYNEAQSKMVDRGGTPYHIDWDVKQNRVTAEGVSTCWFWFFASTDGCRYAAPGFTMDSGVAAAKDSATYHAVENAKSDALLGCMYRITKTSEFFGIYKETRVEVKGFPAVVKSVDLIKDRPVVIGKDQQIVRIGSWELYGDRGCPEKPDAKPRRCGFFSFLGFGR